MDIIFKNTNGNQLGYISGEDIKNTGGNRVGYISGGDIKDTGGNRIGYISGNDIKDTYGNRVGYISGNDIKDTYGNRVGYVDGSASNIEMCAAGLLLLNLKAAETQEKQRPVMPERKGPEGFWGWLFFFLVFFFSPFVDNIRYFICTANRKEWWGTLGIMFLLMMVLTFLGIGQAGTNVLLIVMGIISIPIILASIRRMHDIGRSGWWILIPIVGFFMCAFIPGKIDGNPYA